MRCSWRLVVVTAVTASVQAAGFLLREAPSAAADKADAPRIKARRSRAADPDLTGLVVNELRPGGRTKVRRTLMANLFPDVTLPLVLDLVERDLAGSFTWTGTIEGMPGSSANIAVNGDSMSALFITGKVTYGIGPQAGGRHEVLEADPSAMPPRAPPIPIAAPALSSTSLNEPPAAADSGATWDVLVAYTQIVSNYYGSAAAVQSLISNAVATTNTAFQNSGVTP